MSKNIKSRHIMVSPYAALMMGPERTKKHLKEIVASDGNILLKAFVIDHWPPTEEECRDESLALKSAIIGPEIKIRDAIGGSVLTQRAQSAPSRVTEGTEEKQ